MTETIGLLDLRQSPSGPSRAMFADLDGISFPSNSRVKRAHVVGSRALLAGARSSYHPAASVAPHDTFSSVASSCADFWLCTAALEENVNKEEGQVT